MAIWVHYDAISDQIVHFETEVGLYHNTRDHRKCYLCEADEIEVFSISASEKRICLSNFLSLDVTDEF